ncbi:hypothetical protein PENTCL1PPCAC_25058, partial [Pristionchus entomophagus]
PRASRVPKRSPLPTTIPPVNRPPKPGFRRARPAIWMNSRRNSRETAVGARRARRCATTSWTRRASIRRTWI